MRSLGWVVKIFEEKGLRVRYGSIIVFGMST
jgi:hypothetical protein